MTAQQAVDSGVIPEAGFLLQVWGGFGLVILFLLLFGINCWVWSETKINYTFIFEFDTKHHLDYRQYMEVSSFVRFDLYVVTYITSIFGFFILLVNVQKLLAATIIFDVVSSHFSLYQCRDSVISIPNTSPI